MPICIVILCAGLGVIDGQAQKILPYNRSALEAGEAWRALTGHFIHLGWSHYFLNMAGLIAVWSLYGPYLRPALWVAGFIGLALGISVGFYLRNPELIQYVGLSGALYGALAMVLVTLVFDRTERRRAPVFYVGSWVLLTYVIFRISYEQLNGQIGFSTRMTGGNVVVDAHLYGVIIGIIFGFFLLFFKKKSLKNNMIGAK